jgi:hypothetical protein
MNRIYISDLDGTLLNNNAELSCFSKNAIKTIIRNRINFSVASARSVKSIQKIFKNITLTLPVIEFNGAFISDLKTGEHYVINDLPLEICENLSNIFNNNHLNYFLSTFNKKGDKLYYVKRTNDGEGWYISNRIQDNDSRLSKTYDLKDHFNEHVVCFTVINKKNILLSIYDELVKKFHKIEVHLQENAYSPNWYWLTVHSDLATKDKAIKILLDKYNFNNENLTVFGDNTNDIKMFEYATKSIAVSNANEQLKKVSNEIIESNELDSVMKYILKENELKVQCFET